MFRNMVTSLLKYERIRTTDTKAKELRRWADHLIGLAKRGDLHSMRQALSIVREKDVVYKLFEEASERFGSIAGGYTRIVKLGRRPGDAADISLIELVAQPEKSKKKKAAKKKRKTELEKKQAAEEKALTSEKEKKAPDSATAESASEKADAMGPAPAEPEAEGAVPGEKGEEDNTHKDK